MTNDRGVALLMVLWVLVLLSVVVGEFCYSMRTEINITRNLKEKTTAYYIALAGFNTAIGEIVARGGMPIETGKEKEARNDNSENINWRLNADMAAVPYKDGYFKIWIDNENGKFDLNSVNRQTIVQILSGFELDGLQRQVIADSILDWRDANNLHRTNGAEDEYYQALPEPYSCRDGDFESVAELLLVRGVTEELYHQGLEQIFTVYERPENVQAAEETWVKGGTAQLGRDKVDLNAASRTLLLALPGMSEESVDEILEYRSKKDFLSISNVIALLGAGQYQKIAPYIQLKRSDYFTIHSVGRLNNSQVEYYLKVLIALDPSAEKKYRVIEWWDQAAT